MPKTAKKTRPAAFVIRPFHSLTEADLKILIGCIDSWQSALASYGGEPSEDRRHIARLEKIKAKLRRGF